MNLIWRLVVVLLFLPLTANAQRPQDWGPVTAYTAPTALVGVPTALAGNGSWTSPTCIASTYARAFTTFVALAAAGTTSVQRYADAACAQPAGAVIPVTPLALTTGGGCPGSSFCGSNSSNDGLPYAALKITITDTSGSTNAVVAMTLLLGAE
jgi:hypothetical protein